MQSPILRREFLSGLGALAAVSCIPFEAAVARALLYPPRDLSYFDTPIPPAPTEIHWGYAAITWGGNDRQAIEDISSLGYAGIQLRSNCIQEFGSPAAVLDLLDKYKLKFVALSSGDIRLDPSFESEDLAKHTANAKFLRDAHGIYLQIIDQRPKDRAITSADYKRLGYLLTELGKRTADLGIPLGYHNHMGSLGEHPEGVEQIMAASDPRYVKLELDIAHYFQGGGDPANAVEKYNDRLLFLHIKDVEHPPAGTTKNGYRFIELGRGLVKIPAVFDALHTVNFSGWAIIELDGEFDKSRTPKESAEISKKYVQDKLGASV